MTGEPWSYENWAPGAPDEIQDGEDYLAFGCIFCPAGTWDDYRSPFNMIIEPSGYVIEFDTGGLCVSGLGTKYCSAGTNSIGLEAQICADGSVSISDDELYLRCFDLPPGKVGMFFYGTQPVLAVLGNGFRCVGGNVQRMRPLQVAGSDGRALLRIDLSAAPYATDFLPGGTSYFQFWYRDGMGSSNLTDALQLTFE